MLKPIELKIGEERGGRIYLGNAPKKGCHLQVIVKCKECGCEKVVGKDMFVKGKPCYSCSHKEIIKKIDNKKHGMSNTRFWSERHCMKERCKRKNHTSHKYYYDKGITYDNNREIFENFYNDMYEEYKKHCEKYGEKQTTLDRIDNSKPYSLNNCRRATCSEQCYNRTFN